MLKQLYQQEKNINHYGYGYIEDVYIKYCGIAHIFSDMYRNEKPQMNRIVYLKIELTSWNWTIAMKN